VRLHAARRTRRATAVNWLLAAGWLRRGSAAAERGLPAAAPDRSVSVKSSGTGFLVEISIFGALSVVAIYRPPIVGKSPNLRHRLCPAAPAKAIVHGPGRGGPRAQAYQEGFWGRSHLPGGSITGGLVFDDDKPNFFCRKSASKLTWPMAETRPSPVVVVDGQAGAHCRRSVHAEWLRGKKVARAAAVNKC